MEIRKVPISLLNAAPYNPRKDLQPGDPEYQKIARSIEKYVPGGHPLSDPLHQKPQT